jgi:hypothetical protein
MRRWFYKIWRSFNPWYVLEVNHRGKERRVIVKDFKKKTPKLLSGYNADGEWFEMRSEVPMDYFVEEYRDDLK